MFMLFNNTSRHVMVMKHYLHICIPRNGECRAQTIFSVSQLPHHKMVTMGDSSDGDGGEVLQQLCLLLFLLSCVCMQVYPGCLRKLQHVCNCETHWTALYIKEPCAEVDWTPAFQESVDCTPAVHSFNATSLPQSNPLVDLANVEKNGLCWHYLLFVIQCFIEDLQCLHKVQ